MPDDLLSIGALARAAGLPVTALRFYDTAGVLRPAHVDPVTGYRWYTPAQVRTARLVASLRQAGMPVADLAEVLAAPGRAHAVLARHRRRLEEDLVAARAHLDAAGSLLPEPARSTVVTADLLAAVGAVRHAVGAHPAWPGLAGVLLHLAGARLRLVGCDGSRLAVATVPVRQPSGPPVRVVAPLALLDAIPPTTAPDAGPVVLGAGALEVLGVAGEPLDAPYPDEERLVLPSGSPGVTVASGELVETAARADDVVVVRLDGGRVALAPPGARDMLGFSRNFLLDAVRAARAEHVALAIDERSALRVSPADRPHDLGLVMPIRLRR
ncbi:MerR family transcriptional regulator [Cellulomonas sp. NS3]|uniref:MerR family transcriptional regulator n=1 Tax=Cellulomonas sp. NS3 TaxID=2973977 RepID=UPI0021632006|nr:MerR family transcriptional regulator [Cellulomonas sp. NS3]